MSATKPTAKRTCREARHLPGHLFKTWNTMFYYTGEGARPFTCSVKPTLCNMLNESEPTVRANLDKLCALGWLIRSGGDKDHKTGKNRPYRYQVLSHDQYVEKHPKSCPRPKFPIGDDEKRPPLTLDEILANNLLRNLPLPPDTILPNPKGKVIAEVMSQLTVEQRFETVSHWYKLSGLEPPADLLDNIRLLPADESSSRHRSTDPGPASVDEASRHRSTDEELASSKLKPQLLQQTGDITPLSPDSGSGSSCSDITPLDHSRRKEDPDAAAHLAINMFQRVTGKMPKKISKVHREALREFCVQYGPEAFAAGVGAWIQEGPWDEKTESHLAGLVADFPSYVQKARDGVARKLADAEAQKKLERQIEAATKDALKFFKVPDVEKIRAEQARVIKEAEEGIEELLGSTREALKDPPSS